MIESLSLGRRLAAARQLVYHVTRTGSLSDIVASSALLSPNARRPPVARHGWGVNDLLGADLVCVSLMPSYDILSAQFPDEEAVILGFDPRAVGDLPHVRPCPHNSATPEATPYLDGSVDPSTAMDHLLADGRWRKGELLIPEALPLSGLKLVTLPDQPAYERWADFVRRDAGPVVKVVADWPAGPRPHFPPWYRPTVRPEVRQGVDQRRETVRLASVDPQGLAPLDLEAVDEELVDEEDQEPDLYEQLYGEGRGRLLSSLPEDPDDPSNDETDSDPWC